MVRKFDEVLDECVDRINQGGEAYLTHTRLGEQLTLRLCVGQTNTEARHVAGVWRLIREAAEQLTV